MTGKTIVVGDEAALLAALRAANGETRIELRAGLYNTIDIKNINPAGQVTITSFDQAKPTEIDMVTITRSSNLVFQDLYFHNASVPANGGQVKVVKSHDIAFIGSEFAGKIDGINTNDGSGLSITDSSRVTVLDNKFHDLIYATYVSRSDHLVLAGNDVRTVREGMDFSDASHVTVDRNLFTQFTPMLTGSKPDHPDGIQFWTSGSAGSDHVEITNNAFLFGNNVPVQGIFIRSEQGDAARHSDFLIANNVYQGQSRHGITVNDADNVRITGNTVVSAPKAGTAYYLDPAINTGNTRGAMVDHNISSMMFSTGDTGRTATANVDAWDERSGVGVSFADLFGKAPSGTASPDAFLARTGSIADILDAGYTHVDRTGNWAVGSEPALIDRYHDILDIAGGAYNIA